ncbi:hypothetical protein SPONN_2619 [uncultured Candidatus Thioglobus sp.]|nr:hypothetical protein SPONN_2619 [uncultured Candidatus Thioglobus sp.]SMN01922.1 hypothetical protein SPONL_201 [uncultured Candidatus Thioglobus sp.]
MLANIEGRKWRHCDNLLKEIPIEHPRSSTTDDVECFFSVLRDLITNDFTLKNVQFEWRKACIELKKRTDPQLPYYYHTSNHDRFYEGDRPSFDVPGKSRRNLRNLHPRRRELLSTLVRGRASLPVPGSKSIRVQYHNLPVDMPPPPGTDAHMSDHTY